MHLNNEEYEYEYVLTKTFQASIYAASSISLIWSKPCTKHWIIDYIVSILLCVTNTHLSPCLLLMWTAGRRGGKHLFLPDTCTKLSFRVRRRPQQWVLPWKYCVTWCDFIRYIVHSTRIYLCLRLCNFMSANVLVCLSANLTHSSKSYTWMHYI